MKTLHEQPLMASDLLQRRLKRCINGLRGDFRPTLTVNDIGKWLNLPDASPLYQFAYGKRPINGEWQVRLSQFFTLIDEGRITLIVKGRKKTIQRSDEPVPPCKQPQPRIDFAAGKLRFD